MTSYYLVRHGVTDWIEAGITQGISDRPLSPFGMEQAQLTGQAFKGLKAGRLFTSPMLRARQTAQPIASITGLALEPLVGLQERDQGYWEGKRDIWRILKGKDILRAIWAPFYRTISSLTGESIPVFRKRILKVWKQIRSLETEESVIIVAHSGVVQSILMHELGQDNGKRKRIPTETCSITEIAFNKEGRAHLVRLNDTSHLEDKAWN